MLAQGSKLSNCYVFKSRLQEYAQKVGYTTPVYETLKEGPSHEPSFRSTVIVNGVRYDSLPGFFNRKAAEQSAAEVALTELAKSGELKQSITVPVHETGLCKNLLQEYAQKMNYAIPTYECQGEAPCFSCTVEIGGIHYIGAAAKSKKEAEIKAARTALLAIQSSSTQLDEKPKGESRYMVIPCKRKQPEVETAVKKEPVEAPKAKKKSRFGRKHPRKRCHCSKACKNKVGNAGALDNNPSHPFSSGLPNTVSDTQLAHEIKVETAGVQDNSVGYEVCSEQLESRVDDVILSDQIKVESMDLLDGKTVYQFSVGQKESSASGVQLSDTRSASTGVVDNHAVYRIAYVQKENIISEFQLPDQISGGNMGVPNKDSGHHLLIEQHRSTVSCFKLSDDETTLAAYKTASEIVPVGLEIQSSCSGNGSLEQ